MTEANPNRDRAEEPDEADHPEERRFRRRARYVVALVAGTALAMLALTSALSIVLMVFAAVVVAVLLSGPAAWLEHRTPLGYGVSLGIVVAVTAVVVLGSQALAVRTIGSQMSELADTLPGALDDALEKIESGPLGMLVPEGISMPGDAASGTGAGTDAHAHVVEGVYDIPMAIGEGSGRSTSAEGSGDATGAGASGGSSSSSGVNGLTQGLGLSGDNWLSRITGAAMNLASAVGAVFVVFGVGIFLAGEPRVYLDTSRRLLPRRLRSTWTRICDHAAPTLRRWFLGRLASMGIIALGTTIGLAIMGLPFSIAIGVLTGALAFIPNIGPVLSVVPPLLVSMSSDGPPALAILGFYAALQAVESNLLTPLIQKRAVRLPPAMLLMVQVVLGMFAGIVGILLAAPLTATAIVVVREASPEFASADAES